MAYQTGSATDMGDLLSKLDTFMVANGWTQDDFDDGATVSSEGFAAWNKNSMYISMRWQADSPNHLAIYQALGHTPGNDPGAHPDDSGSGFNTNTSYSDGSLGGERAAHTLGNGPFLSYHFFEQDASPAYVHVVVETESEIFRHFGWGELEKFNDWTGGEYCYGQYAFPSTSSTGVRTDTTILLDGLFSSTQTRAATIHAEGLPNQGASEKWLQHGGFTSKPATNDTAGEERQNSFGGARAGPIAYPLGQFRSDVATGHIPMYPLGVFLRDWTNDFTYFLGSQPDVRGIDMFNFASGQTVTIGSDQWVLFPTARRTEDNVINRTYYQGFAYKKVTA